MGPFEKQTQKVKLKKRENQGHKRNESKCQQTKKHEGGRKKMQKNQNRERARMCLQRFFKKGQEKKLKLS